MTRLYWYFDPSSPQQTKQKPKKTRQSWTPSDKTFWIRVCRLSFFSITSGQILILCILIDFLIQIFTVRMGLFIMYLKGSQPVISKYNVYLFDGFDSLRPINNLSVKQRRVFLG